jgi:hypothetical protein
MNDELDKKLFNDKSTAQTDFKDKNLPPNKSGADWEEPEPTTKKRYTTYQEVLDDYRKGQISVNQARKEFGLLPISENSLGQDANCVDLDFVHWKHVLSDFRAGLKRVAKGTLSNKNFKLLVESRIGKASKSSRSDAENQELVDRIWEIMVGHDKKKYSNATCIKRIERYLEHY